VPSALVIADLANQVPSAPIIAGLINQVPYVVIALVAIFVIFRLIIRYRRR
jgi:hypothetical protein